MRAEMHPVKQNDQTAAIEDSTDEQLSPTRLNPQRRLLVSRIAVAAPAGLLGKKPLIAYTFTTATIHLGLFTFGSTGTIALTTTAVFAHLGVSMVLFLIALFAGGSAFANPWTRKRRKENRSP